MALFGVTTHTYPARMLPTQQQQCPRSKLRGQIPVRKGSLPNAHIGAYIQCHACKHASTYFMQPTYHLTHPIDVVHHETHSCMIPTHLWHKAPTQRLQIDMLIFHVTLGSGCGPLYGVCTCAISFPRLRAMPITIHAIDWFKLFDNIMDYTNAGQLTATTR